MQHNITKEFYAALYPICTEKTNSTENTKNTISGQEEEMANATKTLLAS